MKLSRTCVATIAASTSAAYASSRVHVVAVNPPLICSRRVRTAHWQCGTAALTHQRSGAVADEAASPCSIYNHRPTVRISGWPCESPEKAHDDTGGWVELWGHYGSLLQFLAVCSRAGLLPSSPRPLWGRIADPVASRDGRECAPLEGAGPRGGVLAGMRAAVSTGCVRKDTRQRRS
jgi:hypothetical protein